MEFRMVEVTWLDSMGHGGWRDRDDAIRVATYDELRHRTVGYLLSEDEHYILVAGSCGEDGELVADTMQIPRVVILTMEDVLRKGGNDGD